MGQVLNWVTLMGFGLVVGGIVLLLFAMVVALLLLPSRGHRHRPRHGRSRSRTGPGPAIVGQPDIRRSALLADTMSLNQIAARGPAHGEESR